MLCKFLPCTKNNTLCCMELWGTLTQSTRLYCAAPKVLNIPRDAIKTSLRHRWFHYPSMLPYLRSYLKFMFAAWNSFLKGRVVMKLIIDFASNVQLIFQIMSKSKAVYLQNHYSIWTNGWYTLSTGAQSKRCVVNGASQLMKHLGLLLL